MKREMVMLILALMLLASCVPAPSEVKANVSVPTLVSNESVFVTCWDNSTVTSIESCPKKPSKIVVVSPEENVGVNKTRQIGEVLLDDSKSRFHSHAFVLDDRIVIVHGKKARHYFLKLSKLEDGTPITDVYLDFENNSAVAYCDIDREGKMYGDSFEYERSKCRDYLNVSISVPFEKWLPRGPLEFLEEYAHREPVLVEDNVQTVSIGGSSKSISPSLHYLDNGKKVILRIDKRYHVPIKIEREGQRAVDFRDTFFDFMVIEGRQYKIGSDWVEYKPVSDYWKSKD